MGGCEVVVSGKLRGQRAKAMKFVDGLMIHSGDPVNDYVDMACRHVLLRQGVLGIKVKIMLPWDESGKIGPKKPLPDHCLSLNPRRRPFHPPHSQRPRPSSLTKEGLWHNQSKYRTFFTLSTLGR